MRALQLDHFSIHASELTPVLLELLEDAAPDWARADLESWDFTTPPESRPTLLFQAFYRHWVQASLGHRLPDDVVTTIVTRLVVGDVPGGFCDRLLRGDLPAWLTDDERRRLARLAFRDGLTWLEERLGPDHDTWVWGALHTLTFVHPFGQLPGRHQRFVNVGPFPVGGDRTTVWPSGGDPNAPFTISGGPSMRFVTDLSRPDRAWATNTLGQGGRPLSRHYKNQVRDFLQGRLHPIWDGGRRRTVVLAPTSPPSPLSA
jgi:penicillin amidase